MSIDVFTVDGTIRWFDPSRGFGFMETDYGDVLLHVSCLRASGFQTDSPGAVAKCKVMRRPKGLQACRVLLMDDSNALDRSQYQHRTKSMAVAESDWEWATVKWFNRDRGFGFLTRGYGTPDIFIHMETLRWCWFTELRTGQMVLVRWSHGERGCVAVELEAVEQ